MELTVLLTTPMPSTRRAMNLRQHLEERVSGAIHMDEHTRPDGTVNRKMVVRRMRGMEPPYPVFICRIEAGRGIVITEQSEVGLTAPRTRQAKPSQGGLLFSRDYTVAERKQKEPATPLPEENKEPPDRSISFGRPNEPVQEQGTEDSRQGRSHRKPQGFSFRQDDGKKKGG